MERIERKIEAVIFDWAGTTVDFGCFAPVNVFIDVFKEAGINVTAEEARIPMGMLKKDHIRAMIHMERIASLWEETLGRAPEESDVDRLYKEFEPLLMKSLENFTDPIEHAIKSTEWLRERGIKIGSTTGYTGKMMEIVSEKAKEKGYYPDCLVTSDETDSKGRPYPFMIFKNMQKLEVESTCQVVKIGDTLTDIREGKNAGCWSIGVVVGSSEMGLSHSEFMMLSEVEKEERVSKVRNSFIEAGADFVIDNLSYVPALIDNIQSCIERGQLPKGISI